MLPFIRRVASRWQLPFGASNTAAVLRKNLTLQYHFSATKKLGNVGNASFLQKVPLLPALAGSMGICAFAYGFSKGLGPVDLKKNSHAYLIALAAACLLLKRKSPALLSVVVFDVSGQSEGNKTRCYKKKKGTGQKFEEVPIAEVLPAAPSAATNETAKEDLLAKPYNFANSSEEDLAIVPPFKADVPLPAENPKKVKLNSERVIDPSFPTNSKGSSNPKNFRTCYPGKLSDKGNISTAIYDCETDYIYHLPDGVLTQEYMDKKYSMSSFHSLLRQKEIYYKDIYENAFSTEDLARMAPQKRALWKRESRVLKDQIQKIHKAVEHALTAFYRE